MTEGGLYRAKRGITSGHEAKDMVTIVSRLTKLHSYGPSIRFERSEGVFKGLKGK
jgi:hypothetical protein